MFCKDLNRENDSIAITALPREPMIIFLVLALDLETGIDNYKKKINIRYQNKYSH